LGNLLEGRTVILHVRSASVIEIIDLDCGGVFLKKEVLRHNFKNYLGENLTAVLHYCAHPDVSDERTMNNILTAAAEFYKKYTAWEDAGIIKGESSILN
jgi:hypothetical protein